VYLGRRRVEYGSRGRFLVAFDCEVGLSPVSWFLVSSASFYRPEPFRAARERGRGRCRAACACPLAGHWRTLPRQPHMPPKPCGAPQRLPRVPLRPLPLGAAPCTFSVAQPLPQRAPPTAAIAAPVLSSASSTGGGNQLCSRHLAPNLLIDLRSS
jgi:hypothetical protein